MGGLKNILVLAEENYLKNYENVVLQDYLATIYRLEEVYGVAKTTRIAEELGVTPATVTKMLYKLERHGLVMHDKYRGARLTPEGRREAEKVIWRHRVCEYFLRYFLKFSLTESHLYAHMMEHLPDEVVDRIFDYVGRPRVCPHGNPLPGVQASSSGEVPLSSVKHANSIVRVVRILGEFRHALQYFEHCGIDIGTTLRVVTTRGRHVVVKLLDTGREVAIPEEYSMLIQVVSVEQSS